MPTFALLGIYLLTFEMLVIFLFAASLPVAFIFWLRGWLGNVRDENPDEVMRLQAKADEEHLAHRGHGQGGGHGHPHGQSHGQSHGH